MRIAIAAYTGCVGSGISGFAEVLAMSDWLAAQEERLALPEERTAQHFDIRVVSESGAAVQPFCGPGLMPDGTFRDAAVDRGMLDLVYVPPAVGMDAVDPDVVRWVRGWHAAGAVACAACAGVFHLAEAGILDGRIATTHWGLVDRFAAAYPGVHLEPERMLVDGGDYMCAGGLTAYFDLALHVVARFVSPQRAAACAHALLIDPGRVLQTPYRSLVGPVDHGDEAVARAQDWLEHNHVQPLELAGLARAAGLGERTLLRRFRKATGRTPTRYLQAVRMEHAKRLLETGSRPVDEIVALVGYGDAPSFYRLFRRFTGLTPGEYRSRFGLAR